MALAGSDEVDSIVKVGIKGCPQPVRKCVVLFRDAGKNGNPIAHARVCVAD